MGADQDVVRGEVMRLHYLEHMSIRAIARRLGLARRTVRRHLGLSPAKNPHSSAPRPSLLDPFARTIETLLEKTPEMRAPQLLEQLRPLGYTGGISILRDRLRKLRPSPPPEAFLTLDFAPGQAMQVDWADFGFALPGVPRRVSAFAAVLCYSRQLYLEFTVSQQMGSFLRCMDRALGFFEGITTFDIFDNMKTVVLEHPRSGPTRFNSRMLAYAQARGGVAVVACTPGHPPAKGRVERPIQFIRDRFWTGRRFSSLLDLNTQAAQWRDDFCNRREHADTGKVPALVFEHEEKARLKPLAAAVPFETDDIEHASVTKSFRVRFDRNRYSVPWRLVGQSVVVRADDDAVRVMLGTKCVADHPRSWSINQDIEHESHRRGLREAKNPSDPAASARGRFGDTGEAYFKMLAAGSRSLRREALRLTYLGELFGVAHTRSAMGEVMRSGHVGVDFVEYVLRHKRRLSPATTPLRLGDPALDAITLREPDLSIYDRPVATRDPEEA
ncbi:MAG: IS21 family transposase [Polyangiaceae bacterium]